MIPWVQLATATVPDGGELRLMQRGQEFSIMAGANELMNSRLSGSEQALASLACEPIRDRPKASILIGGLGMGFTLRAAQALLASDATLAVAELVPAVTAWAKGPLAALHGESLADPRVTIYEADVGDLIRSAAATYDAILLDVDNGPRGLSRPGNDGLYSPTGLAAAKRALRPGGILAVWSAVQDTAFTRRLRDAGFAVEEATARAHRPGKGARHVVWVASRN
jgi:spermidine synthase